MKYTATLLQKKHNYLKSLTFERGELDLSVRTLETHFSIRCLS
jgi:hypothetical protein